MPITPMNKNTACAIIAAVDGSSARETAMRVAAGAITKNISPKFGIEIRGCLTQMGDIPLKSKTGLRSRQNPFFCPDRTKSTR